MMTNAPPGDEPWEVHGLERGQPVTLIVAWPTGERAYASELESRALVSGPLVVSWPHDEAGQPLELRSGQGITLAASSAHDALYVVETRADSGRRHAAAPLVLRVGGPWERVQRRDNVRLPLAIGLARAELALPGGRYRPLAARLRDVSAGGTRLRLDVCVSVGDRLRLALNVPDGGPWIVTGAPVRRVTREGPAGWDVGCELEDVQPAERDRIVRCIFAEQRALARLRRAGGSRAS